jgi:dynactin complex subunit
MMRNVFTKVIKSYLKNKQFYLEREVSLSLLFLGKVSDFSDIKLLPLFNVFIESIEWVKMQQKKIGEKNESKRYSK